MPDTTLDALRLAVLADPQDDSCRLILADALDEAGDCDYAEFIRVQCALARLPDDAEGCFCASKEPGFLCAPCLDLGRRRDALRHREQELWGHDPAGSEWAIFPESPGVGPDPSFASVRRGFVAEVRCTLSHWVRHGPDVVRKHPVERVVVNDYLDYCHYHDPAPHQGAWVQGAGARLPFSVPGRFDTHEDFAQAIGDKALLWAKRRVFPCKACRGEGRLWKDVGPKTGTEPWPEIRYVCPPPQRLLFDCDACQGQGWKIAP